MKPPPTRFRPQLALLVKAVPEGPDWFHEIKYDGYRIGCRVDRPDGSHATSPSVSLYSRNNRDWTSVFPEIVAAARNLPATNAFLDGEVAVVLPLETRKRRLKGLLAAIPRPLFQYSEHVLGTGPQLFERACQLKLEGIVSKRRDLPYQAGRHDGWVKTKCVKRQEFVIGGFTEPEGSRQGIGALLVGYFDNARRLIFAGKVGTGFTNKSSLEIRQRLESISRETTPFAEGLDTWLARHAHWVQPDLVAEATFTEWTDEGRIRHPSFQGLRADKSPSEIRREQPVAQRVSGGAKSRMRATSRTRPARNTAKLAGSKIRPTKNGKTADVAGVRISHPDRVMYPEVGLTKLDVARYYESVADRMLPHLRGRPLTLVRCGEGLPTGEIRADCIYMKHSKVWAPESLRRVRIRERTKTGDYLIADSTTALLSLVQMDILEIHTWNSMIEHVEQPDRLVFDIDPGPEVRWPQVVDAARLVRSVLQAVHLESFVKTTGGKGLHVVVPIAPALSWEACLEFSREVAAAIVRTDPRRYTTAFRKAGRERQVLIDYLRNNRTNTSIAAFSTRARRAATVSAPMAWDELDSRRRPDRFTVRTAERWLSRQSRDPWEGYWKSPQRISNAALRAIRSV